MMDIFEWILVPLLCLCALQAVRARRLIGSALWLAGASACLAILLYRLGAHEVAVIELSVGAGLVTVMFVYAISMAGEDAIGAPSVVSKPLAGMLAGLGTVLLGLMLSGGLPARSAQVEAGFAATLWQARALDVLLLLVLVFAGVLGVAGLLADEDGGYAMPDLRARLARRSEVAVAEPTKEEVAP